MRNRTPSSVWATSLLLAVFSAGAARAQPAARPSESAEVAGPGADAQDSLARAKDLFRQGVALFEAGELDGALDRFRRSMELYPSAKNTINAALCLDRLEHYDEALELYEQALAAYSNEVDEEDTAGLRAAMAALRPKVGNLRISYNVAGSVVVDGRPRGTLPLPSPLRLLPGRHVVRVLRDGYATWEKQLEIHPGETLTVDARLTALSASGGLRVEDSSGAGTHVIVDGAVVGDSPWEGILAPGPHLVQTRNRGQASALARAVIVEGQTTLLRVTSRASGPPVVLSVDPASADLSLDGVSVGRGRWEATLPAGDYTVVGSEEGYTSSRQLVRVRAGAGPTQQIALSLRVDPSHPRWPKRPQGHLWLGAYLSGALGPGLRSGPEADCRGGCRGALARGGLAGTRIGYELAWRMSVEVVAGYATLWSTVERDIPGSFDAGGTKQPVDYHLQDTLRFKGPLIGAGASYPLHLSGPWHLRSRLSAGFIFAESLDAVSGTASSAVDEQRLEVDRSAEPVRSTPLFVMPELGLERAMGPLVFNAAVALLFVPQTGPTLPQGVVGLAPAPCRANPASASCAAETNLLANEHAYGPFFIVAPTVSATYVF